MARVAAEVSTEIRVLGPVELWRDGEPVHVGGPRQSALLALLVSRANEVVSGDRLLEELFGDGATAGSANAVQAAVSRLRRLLEPGALETRGRGYVLHVGADQLDSARFERLLAEGRAQLGGGDAATAAATLREALSLWRGAALGDLAVPESVRADARRLDELRVVGLMDRIEAELELGAAQQLVPELESLVAEHPLQERLRGQLMLALYRCGRQADALAAYRDARRHLNDELGLEPSRALQELERAILRQDAELEPAAAASEPVVLCPFKGLAAFTTGDAAYYFGRERMVDEVIARLADRSFVGVVGSSGSGKSSLLQAGVLTALAAGALPGSTTWRRALLRPGAHPVAELPGEVDLLAVDQLEEAFTLCRDDAERATFFDELARRARSGTVVLVALRADFYGRCAAHPEFASLLSANHVLLGAMRRDELAHAIEGPAERAGLQAERELVDLVVGDVADEPGALPLLSTTLVELWRRRTGRVLTAASYQDSGGVRGAVARLAEHAFAQLDKGEQDAARVVLLRLADEQDGAIVRRRVPIDELDIATDDDVARVVGVLTEARLLTLAEGTVEVSHERLLTEWPRLRGWLDEDSAGRRLRGHLAASAREWDERGREPADLYRGPRLVAALDWSADHKEELNALEREFLDAARTEHERELAEQRRRNRRLRASLVGAVLLLAVAVVAGLLALQKSRTASHDARVELAGRLGAEAVSQPRIDLAMLLAREALNLDDSPQTEGTLLATLLRTPSVTGTFTMPIRDRPQHVSVSPNGRSIAAVTNNNVMRIYDTRTHQESSFPALNANYTYVPKSGDMIVGDPNFGPSAFLVDPRTGRTLQKLPINKTFLNNPTSLNAWLASPDGRNAFLVYGLTNQVDGTDGPAYVEMWRLGRNGSAKTVRLGGRGMNAATALPGDRIIFATDRRIVTWDAKTGSKRFVAGPRFKPPIGCWSCAISPDGRILGYGLPNGTVHFFDIARGTTVTGLGGHSAPVQQVAFSPDSRIAVSSGDDGIVVVWDPKTGQALERLTGHIGRVQGVAFSPNGKTLYTSGLDGTVLRYDLGGSKRFGTPFTLGQRTHSPAPGQVLPEAPVLAVSPTGGLFAASAVDSFTGTAPSKLTIYSTSPLRKVGTIALPKHSTVGAGAWARQRFVVGADHGRVQVWDVTGRKTHPDALLHGLSRKAEVAGIAATDDGRVIAAVNGWQQSQTAPEQGELAIWRDGKLVGGKALHLTGFGDAVALSPDGRIVAVAVEPPPGRMDGRVLVVNALTGAVERRINVKNASGSVRALAFAPDGTLATGTWSGIVNLWNPETGQSIGHPTLVAPAPVSSIAFSPDGKTFATSGGSSGGTRIWQTATLQQVGSDFPGGAGFWGSVGYTPDSRYLVSVFGDGTAYRWPVTVSAWENQACAVAGRTFTREEWRRFVGSPSYSKVCP
jgi:WD40 repeat protein/DNA-binding SARP family transcriptional activator